MDRLEPEIRTAPGAIQDAERGEDIEEWDSQRVRVLRARLSDANALLAPSRKQLHAGEQYRIARTKILELLRPPFRLVVTSPSAGDGKTVTAVNLAVALALRGEGHTLLIDGDMRRGGVHQRFDIAQSPGLAEVLTSSCRLEQALFRIEQLPSLFVLPSGKPDGNATELLASSRWRVLAESARQRFSNVIVDSPPVDILADYDLIAATCDGAVLVVRPNHTDRSLCLAACAKMRPKLTGVVINGAEEWFLWKNRHRGYYYYGRGKRPGLSTEGRKRE